MCHHSASMVCWSSRICFRLSWSTACRPWALERFGFVDHWHTHHMYISWCIYKLPLVEGYVLTQHLEFIDKLIVCLASWSTQSNRLSHLGLCMPSSLLLTFKTLRITSHPHLLTPVPLAPLCYISKKSLNFENSGELWGTLQYSRVLKVQRFFADVVHWSQRTWAFSHTCSCT